MGMFKTAQQSAILELKANRDFGLELLKAFHDSNKKFSNYKISFDDLVKMLESRLNQKHFVDILGGSVLNSGTSKSDALSAMRSLATFSRGRVPEKNIDFKSAIIDKATKFSYVDAVAFTVVETTKQVVQGVQAVGDTLINTGKILNILFPIAVVYFLYIFLKKKVA